MPHRYKERVSALSPAKALSIGLYGESVASYRYRTLHEKTTHAGDRRVFAEMAEEEQGHHQLLQAVIKRHFPGSDFVLAPEDKELVIVGPRMIEVTDEASCDHALGLIYESERLTGHFYAALHETLPVPDLRSLLKEMADECFEHAERISQLRANRPQSSA